MHIRRTAIGRRKEDQDRITIYSTKEGASEHSKGVVSYSPKLKQLTIQSNVKGEHGIHINGVEHIKFLRDVLIQLCKEEEIK